MFFEIFIQYYEQKYDLHCYSLSFNLSEKLSKSLFLDGLLIKQKTHIAFTENKQAENANVESCIICFLGRYQPWRPNMICFMKTYKLINNSLFLTWLWYFQIISEWSVSINYSISEPIWTFTCISKHIITLASDSGERALERSTLDPSLEEDSTDVRRLNNYHHKFEGNNQISKKFVILFEQNFLIIVMLYMSSPTLSVNSRYIFALYDKKTYL